MDEFVKDRTAGLWKVALVVVVIAVIAMAALFVPSILPKTIHHVERTYPSDETRPVILSVGNIRDCNLTISFTNEPDLLYSMDVELYLPDFVHIEERENDYLHVSFNGGADRPTVRVKNLDITLGNRAVYTLVASGTSMNTTIIYSNGAHIEGDPFLICSRSGIIRVLITEDITVGSGRSMMTTTGPNTLYLYVDLRDGVNGIYGGPTPIQNSGWAHDGFNTYRTDPADELPLLDLRPGSATIYAFLED